MGAVALSSFLAKRTNRPLLRLHLTVSHWPTNKTPGYQNLCLKLRSIACHRYQSVRLFSGCQKHSNNPSDPSTFKTLEENGYITTAKRTVDVKKVLVIGSGGLSIGQAGEFDYSGL